MGKSEPWSSKSIAKAIKAKGLLKTRLYCQVCEKQCRDENGMKCHKQTEGHLRNIQIFRDNAHRNIAKFSNSFKKGFIDILSSRHNTKRVLANVVYNEYIQDRNHVHLNATKWPTLTGFIMYLGENNICQIDNNERGWYIRWIDSGLTLTKLQARSNQSNICSIADDDEDRSQRLQLKQIHSLRLANNNSHADTQDHENASDPDRNASLIISKFKTKKASSNLLPTLTSLSDDDDLSDEEANIAISKKRKGTKHTTDNTEGNMTKYSKTYPNIADILSINPRPSFCLTSNTWLVPGIIVKIISHSVANPAETSLKYMNHKGIIISVFSDASKPKAVLRMLDNNTDTVTVKSSQIETVLPDLGHYVLIVSSDNSFSHRGEIAKLVDVDIERFKASVKFDSGGQTELFDYDNVCKISKDKLR